MSYYNRYRSHGLTNHARYQRFIAKLSPLERVLASGNTMADFGPFGFAVPSRYWVVHCRCCIARKALRVPSISMLSSRKGCKETHLFILFSKRTQIWSSPCSGPSAKYQWTGKNTWTYQRKINCYLQAPALPLKIGFPLELCKGLGTEAVLYCSNRTEK